MLFADGSTDTMWIIGTLFGALVGSGSVIAILFRLLISSKDREFAQILNDRDKQLEETKALKKAYAEMASEAVKSAAETTNYYRIKEGKPPLPVKLPVVPEGSSPPTVAQREVAELATLRATMAAIKIITGQEPRKEPGITSD